jgi:hypothetical protein
MERLPRGSRVEHTSYGRGTVTSRHWAMQSGWVRVYFDGEGAGGRNLRIAELRIVTRTARILKGAVDGS